MVDTSPPGCPNELDHFLLPLHFVSSFKKRPFGLDVFVFLSIVRLLLQLRLPLFTFSPGLSAVSLNLGARLCPCTAAATISFSKIAQDSGASRGSDSERQLAKTLHVNTPRLQYTMPQALSAEHCNTCVTM